MRYAVLDLGTNTFNLLIAESNDNKNYKIILSEKESVKLGEGGINNQFINDAAVKRGFSAIALYMEQIKNMEAEKVKAFATSAIRDASNGNQFINDLKNKFNLDVNIISGDREAELIYKGVIQTLPGFNKPFIILDIGGGSNEFIIGNNTQILWKQSFNLGMARLLDRFKPSDPITATEINKINSYLDIELTDLFEAVELFKPEIFVGASGSFDSFISMLAAKGQIIHNDGDVFHNIPFNSFEELHQLLVSTTKSQREKIEELEPVRRDMIVLASIFVMFVLKKTRIKNICQSAYSLKEGAIFDMIRE